MRSRQRDRKPPDNGEAQTKPYRAPTSADVAQRAGVSRATVSYVLNELPDSRISEETRARVLAAAEELGYTAHAMARSLRSGRTDIILIPQTSVPIGPILGRYYEELGAQLGAQGYTAVLHLDTATRGVKAAHEWASLRPAGVLVEAERVTRRSIELLRIAGTRAIMVMDDRPSRLAPTLLDNQHDIGACAAQYLISKGHRRLAAIVPREANLLRLGVGRWNGFERVCGNHGLSVERVDLALDKGEAQQLAASWKVGPRPTALFTYNDEYGMLVMHALRHAGLAIPDDIALVGADNLPICALMEPQLTSVALGHLAAIPAITQTLHALIQGARSDAPPIPFLQPQIVVRESA